MRKQHIAMLADHSTWEAPIGKLRFVRAMLLQVQTGSALRAQGMETLVVGTADD